MINGARFITIFIIKIGKYTKLKRSNVNPANPHKLLMSYHPLEALGKSFITFF